MIYVEQGATNKIILDVTVNSYADYFLIKFTDPYSQDYKVALFANQAENCDYYLIHIEETASESLVSGQVTLSPRGSWDVDIYAQASSSNLEISLADEFIGTDKLTVIIGDSEGGSITTESGLELTTESGRGIETDGED